MAKLPQVSGNSLIRVLKKDGWVVAGQKGSHVKLVLQLKPVGKARVTIPQHKVIKKGTLARILKDTGLTVERLKKLI